MDLTLGLQLGILLALGLSVVLLTHLDADIAAVARRLRGRLLLGIPVGTLTAMGLVVAVYLFLQDGLANPYSPVTIPFTSWSYLYPLGMVTAPFAHQGFGHLLGNLIGFLVFGSIAEYAVGHFPTARGTHAFGSWRTNPYLRALLFFPAGVVLAGLATSAFAWGPIIGFSGVVFAAAGFALVRYPMVTVVALVGREFVGTLYSTLREPIVYASASPSFGPPWWAGIAIQGHLLGFLVGVLLGMAVVIRRGEGHRPGAGRIWLGTLIAGSSLTLWAIWWFEGASSYVLYRGPGLLLLLALAGLLAIAVGASDRPVIEGITRRQVAVALLALPVITMGFVAAPLNLTTIGDSQLPGDPIEVGEYQVAYAEEVPNQRIGAINISVLGEATTVNASGVIVVNRERQIWDEAVSAGQLGHSGRAAVPLGGIGWRETVDAKRQGWRVSGGGTVYTVSLQPPDGEFTAVFDSDPVQAAPVIAGRNISLVPRDGVFMIAVHQSNRTPSADSLPETSTRMPAVNGTVEVGGLTFERAETVVYASRNDTRVPMFERESYQ